MYEVLDARGIEVYLVNTRYTRNLPGRKTDVQESQRLLKLHTYGLLSNSFHPPAEIRTLRIYWRQRGDHVAAISTCIQRMQKVLTQMNLQLANVISDVSGPYTFVWSGVPAGTYSVTAVAFDNQGASASSAAHLTVSAAVVAPTIEPSLPPTHVRFAVLSDHATTVTNYVFNVFASTANPATAKPLATSDLGKPAPSATDHGRPNDVLQQPSGGRLPGGGDGCRTCWSDVEHAGDVHEIARAGSKAQQSRRTGLPLMHRADADRPAALFREAGKRSRSYSRCARPRPFSGSAARASLQGRWPVSIGTARAAAHAVTTRSPEPKRPN